MPTDNDIEDKIERIKREQEPIIKELRKIGYNIDMLAYFINTSDKYEDAIPIFKKYLNDKFSRATRESLIRSLAVRWCKDTEIVDILLNLFENEEDSYLRWVIGNTLSVIITSPKHANEALSILKSGRYGGSANMLIVCYARIYKEKAIPDLLEFIKDEDKGIRNQSIIALGKLKAKEARPHIEPYLTNEDSWVRNIAKSAIKKIDKAK